MQLAIFDLDNTLIAGDSDYLWGEYLCERGIVDHSGYRERHREYYDDYRAGRLDIREFLRFQLKPLADNSLEDLVRWRADYIDRKIRPILLDMATATIADHRRRGHVLLIITATNRFITEPIAELLGIPNLIASNPEFRDGSYTGEPEGLPSYREGKVERLRQWLTESNEELNESWFYSDSHNDIPLLEWVDHPVAVDPDEDLASVASERDWPVISFR